MTRIVGVDVEPLDLPLAEPFEIALGTQHEASNVLVTVETAAGVRGHGEASPDPQVTGETQASTIEIVRAAADQLVDGRVDEYRTLVEALHATYPGAVSALFAVETAVIDAYCRTRDVPLSELFGGRPTSIQTDLTVPIVPPQTAAERAATAVEAGFETLKVKVGTDVAADVERVRAVADAAPGATLTVDANQGWTVPEAVRFDRELVASDVAITLLEQPVERTDVRGLAAVRDRASTPVAADEAVFTPSDALRVLRADAADVVNVKLGKSGLLGAAAIAAITRAADRELMIGCMLESAIGLHASAHVVAGIGGFSHVDLDAGRLLEADVASTAGPVLDPTGPGHGIDPR